MSRSRSVVRSMRNLYVEIATLRRKKFIERYAVSGKYKYRNLFSWDLIIPILSESVSGVS